MANKIYAGFDQAVADIPHGATVMFGGFGGVGAPQNLMAALLSLGVNGITGISNEHGGTDGRIDVGTLIEARQISKMICSFTSNPHPSRVTPFVQLYNDGLIEAELVPMGTLAERIRAAAFGIGGFYTPTAAGTEAAEGKEQREFHGRLHVFEFPLPADYAFIRAWKADTMGNLQFRLALRNFNPIMAMAAKTTIVEVETAIVDAGELDPDHIHVPGIYVDRVVHIPADGVWA